MKGFHKFQSWRACVLVSSEPPSRVLHAYCETLIIRHCIGGRVHVRIQRLSDYGGFHGIACNNRGVSEYGQFEGGVRLQRCWIGGVVIV